MAVSVGIDVGGTKCLAVALDGVDVVASSRRPTPHSSELVDLLVEMTDELAESCDAEISSVGVGVPGLVTADGVIVASPNLRGADHLAIAADLGERGPWAVHVDNDATAAAFGEWQLGAARGAQDAVLVTFGTGIGGGLVIDGEIRRGANGFAGEIGHITLVAGGHECACGRRGCWEAYASGTALRARTSGISGAQLARQAADGDDNALQMLDEYASWIAAGLASVSYVTDPEVCVIGGGVIADAPEVLAMVERHFVDAMYAGADRPLPRVSVAVLGERAGAIGSALLASRR